jgi:hypothetical protein
MYLDLVDKWKLASVQLSRIARANDIAYVHFLQPNQYVPGGKIIGAEERSVAVDESFSYATAVRKGYPYLIAAGADLARQGVAFHDLTTMFAGLSEPLYRDKCCHLNQRGSDLLAGEIGRIVAADERWRSR